MTKIPWKAGRFLLAGLIAALAVAWATETIPPPITTYSFAAVITVAILLLLASFLQSELAQRILGIAALLIATTVLYFARPIGVVLTPLAVAFVTLHAMEVRLCAADGPGEP